MYHRVHWPADATLVAWCRIPGRLYPVNALAVRHVDRLFAVNRRAVLRVDTDRFGPLVLVLVGATNVGRIELACEREGAGEGEGGPSRPLLAKRGDELGAFHLGSTVVLLAADPRLTWIGPGEGELVRMGEALWRRA
jgi:phosphatidylserine decarboxylase